MAGLYEAFSAGRDRGEARKAKKTLADYMMPATRGDQNALAQVYGVDPNAGMQAEKFARQTQEDDMGEMVKAANVFLQTKNPQAYSYVRERVIKARPELAGMPATLTPNDESGAEKFMQAFVSSYGGSQPGGAVQSTYVNDKGERVAIMRDGSQKILGGAAPNVQIIEGQDGFYGVNKSNLKANRVKVGDDQPQATGGAQAPGRSDMEADIELANAMSRAGIPSEQIDAFLTERGQRAQNSAPTMPATQGPQLQGKQKEVSPLELRRVQLAEEAAARAREAAERSRFGNAPAGFRFRQDGSLEAIPGGPKPAGAAASEDERKAAGWYMQANKAFDDMESAIGEDPAADDPGILETYVPVDEIANRTRSPARQRYAQASGAFSEAVLRAATGAGVNKEEAAQKIRELTPQRGDTDDVKAQKRASLLNYLQALQSRAGRALPQGQAPATQTGPRRLKFNPATGKLE